MRVVLDATGLGSGAGGDETMLTGVLEGLAVAAEADDAFVVVAATDADLPAVVMSDARFEVHRVARRSGLIHFGAVMPRVLSGLVPRPDLVFSPTHGPIRSPIPLALMVQDLSFVHRPQDYPLPTRLRLQRAVRAQVRSARVVLTVSEHARGDLIETYGLDPARVFRVYNAALSSVPIEAGDMEAQRGWLRDAGVPGPFFLYLGNLHPRKNVVRAIEAFGLARAANPSLADHRLVIAGGRWWGSGEQEAAKRLADPDSVVFLGRVDEAQRELLLHSAVALVYPSLFEGFGLPPLEAMSRGTPVVAARATSIPEVVGDGGLLVDPLNTADLAEALISIATDPALAAELAERGRRRAASFSVAATGEALLAAFAAAIDTGGRGDPPRMGERNRAMSGAKTVADYADDWEHNAQSDAHFAILSDPARNDRSWEQDADGFMASGEKEIARVIDFLESAGIHPRFGGRVLDFGCGLGRLTNALGRRFDTAVGVDISPTMVDRAQAQAPAGVSFVVNRSDDLSQFDDSSFDFVYSNIVLQHVSNELQRAYLAEFCRVLTPGGLAVIQLPSLRRGLKGTVKRLLPPKLAASMRRYLRPSRLLRRDDYVIHMEMNCLPENDVWRIVEGAGCVVAHCAFSNAAKADFGGNLIFTGRDEAYANAAGGGFVSPVYVIRRPYE
ncbi:MAG: glycosyltransferase [Candidatus Microthrix subdominans]|jgi:glycosyltransferase involved in cell wall biosynthesis/SAM-dependent methyltransferase|uniref:Glycosyltransferase n=1 Tax=Candidatus Neomicrothrix subdominans TaxID=2954438 RepID=A0A936NER2_9ACTN|nr:glycosyltransferase [Candidatus Microthrix sp.]MBK9297651.1 glycosyltransferase [Candidatus Microthrix subdominans]MBK6437512.1 glycosyltransferase [Candidatus Microthrix sp.]MBK6969938.1 glycosyltransferase [Candidatus Microthrix sp.]MBK7165974.1 glycosyltransferase [Candidatus Microthrix sp.]MBK9561487.1 glycosyltransferase [Candidatus Microthrix sp.]